ncbi:MAG: 2,3-bisphosphoglycerate-independent phosphoglycerate mutase [Alphaproteobacteria bacterium]
MSQRPKPVVLCILDGWGERAEREDNAIAQAHTPNWDRLKRDYPHGVLSASEGDVGLPAGQMGNSEVGHMNIGAGRVVMQDLPRIDAAIEDGSLAKNAALRDFIAALQKSGGTCHLLGLLSDGGVHSHISHIVALANIIADAGVKVAVHAFLDGRDVAPKSAVGYIERLKRDIAGHYRKTIHIYSAGGRYYAMDRDKRWERVEKAYRAIVYGEGLRAPLAQEAVLQAYARGESDEFVLPAINDAYGGMQDGDGLLMANFRADRARQILTALLDPGFAEFPRERVVKFAATLGMVEYSDALNRFMPALFPQQSLEDNLGALVAKAGLKQLHIAETEKYAHVTFFFNGGREEPYAGEDRILVPSPKVATYDLRPEMSAFEVTDRLVAAIETGAYDFIVVNYANADMVGHSGDLKAAMKAVEAVDACIGRLAGAVEKAGGALLITADHGNVEQMHDHDEGQPHTAHTLNPVPCILVGARFKGRAAPLPSGVLADVAPTLLSLLALPQPAAMTGRSLLSP